MSLQCVWPRHTDCCARLGNGTPQKASASHWEISHFCVSIARSQQQTLSNSCNYLLTPGAVRKMHQLLEQRKCPRQGSQRLHGATVQPNSPPQKSQFLPKSRQKELPQSGRGSTFILLLLPPGWAVILCRNSAGTQKGRKQRMPEGKAGKGSCSAKTQEQRRANAVALNPACLRAGGLCHSCPTRDS